MTDTTVQPGSSIPAERTRDTADAPQTRARTTGSELRSAPQGASVEDLQDAMAPLLERFASRLMDMVTSRLDGYSEELGDLREVVEHVSSSLDEESIVSKVLEAVEASSQPAQKSAAAGMIDRESTNPSEEKLLMSHLVQTSLPQTSHTAPSSVPATPKPGEPSTIAHNIPQATHIQGFQTNRTSPQHMVYEPITPLEKVYRLARRNTMYHAGASRDEGGTHTRGFGRRISFADAPTVYDGNIRQIQPSSTPPPTEVDNSIYQAVPPVRPLRGPQAPPHMHLFLSNDDLAGIRPFHGTDAEDVIEWAYRFTNYAANRGWNEEKKKLALRSSLLTFAERWFLGRPWDLNAISFDDFLGELMKDYTHGGLEATARCCQSRIIFSSNYYPTLTEFYFV